METAWLVTRGPQSAPSSAMATGAETWTCGSAVLMGVIWVPNANLMSAHGPQPQPHGQSVCSEELSLGSSVRIWREIAPCEGTQKDHPLGAIRTSEAHERASFTRVRRVAKQRIAIFWSVAPQKSSASAATVAIPMDRGVVRVMGVPARSGGEGNRNRVRHLGLCRSGRWPCQAFWSQIAIVDLGKAQSYLLRGPRRMISEPSMQTPAPRTSHWSGRFFSTAHNQTSDERM